MTKTTRQTMQAIVQTEEKVTASLELQEVPVPTLKPGEVLVEVKAAGVNRADLLQTQGNYPVPAGASEILGLECAGVIVMPATLGKLWARKSPVSSPVVDTRSSSRSRKVS